jgi:hypothetical protein
MVKSPAAIRISEPETLAGLKSQWQFRTRRVTHVAFIGYSVDRLELQIIEKERRKG